MKVNIYCMRHGEAVFQAASDAERPLSPTGQEEAQRMGRWLAKEQEEWSLVLVSPFLRAQQTMNAVLSHLPIAPDAVQTVDGLVPSGNAGDIHDYIDGEIAVSKIKNVLVICHMPIVSYLTASLTTEHNCPLFPTAGIAKIVYDVQKSSGKLIQLLSPLDV